MSAADWSAAAAHLRERARTYPGAEGRLALLKMARELEGLAPPATPRSADASIQNFEILPVHKTNICDLYIELKVANVPQWFRDALRVPYPEDIRITLEPSQ